MVLPRSDAKTGATLEVTILKGLPSLISAIPAKNARALISFVLKPSARVLLRGEPGFSVRLPSPPLSRGAYYAWGYDSIAGWRDFGPITLSGNLLSFGGTWRHLNLSRRSPYTVIAFTAPAGATLPAASSTPAPAPTPTGAKLYVVQPEQTVVENAHARVLVYTEDGQQVFPSGSFSDIPHFTTAIAYNSVLDQIVVASRFGTIDTFDKNGNRVGSETTFTGGAFSIAIDQSLQRVYASLADRRVNGRVAPLIGKIFTYVGNQLVEDSEAFRATAFTRYNALAVAVDPFTHFVYFADDRGDIDVYDQNGNPAACFAGLSNLSLPASMTFDTSNRNFYVVNADSTLVVAFDENGHVLPTPGGFPGLVFPVGITFDPLNKRLYVYDAGGSGITRFSFIKVYDEQGNPIETGGTFPNLGEATLGGITFVP